jgi:hypothetical protein
MNKQHRPQNPSTEHQAALDLLSTTRGRYIVGQALSIARQALKDTEPSNAADMELLGLNLFSPFFDLFESGVLKSNSPEWR